MRYLLPPLVGARADRRDVRLGDGLRNARGGGIGIAPLQQELVRAIPAPVPVRNAHRRLATQTPLMVHAILRAERGHAKEKAMSACRRRHAVTAPAAPPAQREPAVADHTELAICDQTIDVTYIPLQTSWMYLVAVLDWFSRYVVSWELDDTLQLPFVLAAAKRALAQATPEIWNSDQESHFTSPQYRALLLGAGVQISMDGKGRALDSIFVARLWRSVKYEEIYLQDYASPREARVGLDRYFAY